jgi:hypothetical protein
MCIRVGGSSWGWRLGLLLLLFPPYSLVAAVADRIRM